MRGRQDERGNQSDRGSLRRARPTRVLALAAFLSLGAARAHAGDCLDAALYGTVLQAHTRAVPESVGTRVDYPGLREDLPWKELLRSVSSCDPRRLTTREAKLAFWINTYNIFAMDLVAKHWPVASIKDIGSFLFPVWDQPAGHVLGRAYTLDEIEDTQLRTLGDPRIHAAIVCASTSCPSLVREPYLVATVDAQLDAAFAAFVANPGKGFRLDRAANTLHLSSLFKWFAADFEKQGGPLAVIARYLGDADRAWLQENGARATLEYMDYDWGVNG